MENNSLQSLIGTIASEIQMLLRFQLAYDRIFKFPDLKAISRSDFVDQIIALKAIENDMLIRICKLDDNSKDKRTIGLNKIKLLVDDHPSSDRIIKLINEFSNSIHQLKTIRRNKQVAHLDVGHVDNDYEPRYDFRSVLNHLVETLDLISQQERKYIWKDGSFEVFDLIEEVLIKPTKIH
jgi:hypothetical protein